MNACHKTGLKPSQKTEEENWGAYDLKILTVQKMGTANCMEHPV